MTLQVSPLAISLGDIQGEFSGTNPISISEYTRGGTYVPNTTQNAAIKTTTADMAFSNYYGTAAQQPLSLVSANLTPSSLSEGATFTLTVTTANAPAGTTLYWAMVGTGTYPAAGADLSVSSGSFSVNSTTQIGTTTIGTSDNIENPATPNVQFYVQIRKDSLSGTVLGNSNTVTITEVWDSVALLGHSVFGSSRGTGGTVTSRFTLLASGVARGTTTFSGTTFGAGTIDGANATSVDFPNQWYVSGQDKTQYSARGTWSGTGGTIAGPASGTWVTLGSVNRGWDLTATDSNASRNLVVDIAPTADTSVILASNTIQFQANAALYTASITSTTPTSVAESGSFSIVVNTSAIPNGTTLYWTLLGTGTNPADAADLTAGGSGSFTTTNASTTLTFATAVNSDTAGVAAETLQIQIRAGGTSGPVIATSSTVTINEPSVYNFSVTIGTYSLTGLSKGYLSGTYGSISGSYITSAGTIDQIYTSFAPGPTGGGSYFTGVSSLNTNWTSLKIGATTFTKATASASGSGYLWGGSSSLYGTNGTVVSCTLNI